MEDFDVACTSHLACIALSLTALWLLPGCTDPVPTRAAGPDPRARVASPTAADPLALVLAPQSATDGEIASLQERVRRDPGSSGALERLGWTFLARARSQDDAGYYALAEQAAGALTAVDAQAGTLLLARALHGQHRFAEAESAARSLTEPGGDPGPHAWAVLGDTLFDQGRVDAAADAYERMMALRPDAQAFARFAEVLFLRGNLPGATDAMWRGARSVSARHAHARAWMHARLSTFLLVQGERDGAERVARQALVASPDSPDALAALARVQLAGDDWSGAAATLRLALPSDRPLLLWALAEALEAGGRRDEAAGVEARLLARGSRYDPRGAALYLASRGRDVSRALLLARAELARRRDVFTLDTLAWCEHAAGNVDAAYALLQDARALGTRDARLDLHAGVIELSVGAFDDAAHSLTRARAGAQQLLPSERARLAVAEETLSATPAGQVTRPVHHTPSHHGENR